MGVRPTMPTCMAEVPGMFMAAPSGEPSAPTCWAKTPRWPAAFEYHATIAAPSAAAAIPVSYP
jgi:hypothetical protein